MSYFIIEFNYIIWNTLGLQASISVTAKGQHLISPLKALSMLYSSTEKKPNCGGLYSHLFQEVFTLLVLFKTNSLGRFLRHCFSRLITKCLAANQTSGWFLLNILSALSFEQHQSHMNRVSRFHSVSITGLLTATGARLTETLFA